LLDGVLLPGGIDVDPRFYDEERHERLEKTDAELDALEFKVLVYADAHSLPVLGVCRGHQVLNVHAGGSLIQDIPTEHAGAVKVVHRYPKLRTEKREHAIAVTKGSVLHQLLGAERIVVNTYHHQAVKRLAPGLTTSARTDDGVVEAIERPGDRFVLGVQFHPERMRVDDGRFDALFQRLVEEARDAHARRVALRQEAP